LKGKGDTRDIGEVGGEFDDKAEEEYGGEEGGGGEGGGSAKMGHVVGELSIEGLCQEEGYVLHRKGQGGWMRVEGMRLIKVYITRNAHLTTNGVPTPITLMLMTESNTLNRLSG
jgi:hypothetical protein